MLPILQKRRYKDIFAGYLALVPPELRGGITLWGVSDASSWYSSTGQPDWPLPFDADYQPKPAAEGIAEALLGL